MSLYVGIATHLRIKNRREKGRRIYERFKMPTNSTLIAREVCVMERVQ